MAEYVDMTPTWRAILPTWLMMYKQAIEGDCTNPDLVKANARAEFFRMADAADQWNKHVAEVKAMEATDGTQG
jgi:hypothetical protein